MWLCYSSNHLFARGFKIGFNGCTTTAMCHIPICFWVLALCAQPLVLWPYARVPRRLGAGGALTILRFAPLARLRPVPGYNTFRERVPGSCTQRCVL
jgi:hypothetical protein